MKEKNKGDPNGNISIIVADYSSDDKVFRQKGLKKMHLTHKELDAIND